MREAVYAGTFDPLTLGHLDVARRAAERFDRLVVAVNGGSGAKRPLFGVEERVKLARECLSGLGNVVVGFGLGCGARFSLRGVTMESFIQHTACTATTHGNVSCFCC